MDVRLCSAGNGPVNDDGREFLKAGARIVDDVRIERASGHDPGADAVGGFTHGAVAVAFHPPVNAIPMEVMALALGHDGSVFFITSESVKADLTSISLFQILCFHGFVNIAA